MVESLFYYADGMLLRKKLRNTRWKAGSRAGSLNKNGYRMVNINSVGYLEHRVIWTIVNGEIPEGAQIDHIDGNTTNNKIENMRLALNGYKDNGQNLKTMSSNTSGYSGVSWNNSANKWASRIGIDGKRKFIGYFDTAEEAHNAYLKFKKEFHSFNPIPRDAASGD